MTRCIVKNCWQIVADVNQQALAVAGKVTFHNCLIAMRPKVGSVDLPTTHDITVYIHNKFIKWLRKLKDDITVSNLNCIIQYMVLTSVEPAKYTGRARLLV
jgi:hypothetical protein